jgi:hypothetical protein
MLDVTSGRPAAVRAGVRPGARPYHCAGDDESTPRTILFEIVAPSDKTQTNGRARTCCVPRIIDPAHYMSANFRLANHENATSMARLSVRPVQSPWQPS